MNERAFIARVEAANTEELKRILQRPGIEEDCALRIHFGPERYERMRQLALSAATRGPQKKKGNVVVLHGIMGGELTVWERGRSQHVWLNFLRLVMGAAGWLRMRDGKSLFDVRATGILKKWYGEMLLGLDENWNVQAYWYDWRKDLCESADDLLAKINGWFGNNAPVHLIAHSMGGLVSRTFIMRHPERWEKAWDKAGDGVAGGKLVMLGTPNHGSFAIPQVINGSEGSVTKLEWADVKHDMPELLEILNTFPGSYQMLPSPLVMPSMEPLYRAGTYRGLNVPQSLLDNALRHHEKLRTVVDGDRMTYIAGYNQATFNDIKDWSKLNSLEAGYGTTPLGDGTVPHRLGFLEKNGKRIPTYFVECEHGALPNNLRVIEACREIMETGESATLPTEVPTTPRGAVEAMMTEGAARALRAPDEIRFRELTERLRPQARGVELGKDGTITPEEKEAEQLLVRSFLASDSERPIPAPGEAAAVRVRERLPAASRRTSQAKVVEQIEIGLVKCGLEQAGKLVKADRPVDAIAVGHYLGVKPQNAELALDKAISQALDGLGTSLRGTKMQSDGADDEFNQVLTLFTERGIVRGELAQPFFLPDPRDPERVLLALAGMGVPGRFGVPELTVLAQELCWSLGRLNRRHLATVLIGAGNGNLPIAEAVGGWLRGIRRALGSSIEDRGHHLQRVTFIERDPQNLREIDAALRKAAAEPLSGLVIRYVGPTDAELDAIRQEARKLALAKVEAEWDKTARSDDARGDDIPVRITVALNRKTYEFAAITQDAAIPQRDIPLDPQLVKQANDELAAAAAPEAQRQCGQLIERLLIPDDIRSRIYTPAPIVLMLDSTTARVHWEMVARTEHPSPRAAGNAPASFDPEHFLGTSYGLTRQLRTTFAPTPEPPPPPVRHLRVLIVADPAEDAPLPGAQAEAEEVRTTFEKFRTTYGNLMEHTIEVVSLFGPAEATRTAVLKKLMLENFDILHFAGHCVYDEEDPANSGWLFSLERDERLTARELNRIDRIPKFVFSNACESGITPDRSEQRAAGLAPSFAEAFFARGVANFVCTAWPVDDTAARTFARRLYGGMLGLVEPNNFEQMHAAMREARRAIATAGVGGARTWGAYQHYGNPFFRLFEASHMVEPDGANGTAMPKTKTPTKASQAVRPAAAKQPRADRTSATGALRAGKAERGVDSAPKAKPSPRRKR